MRFAPLVICTSSGCSAAKNAAEWRKDEAAYDAPQEKPGGYNAVPGADAPSSPEGGTDQDAGSYAQAPSVLSEEKLVYTCDMSIETTEYKETAAAIKAKVKEFGGIIESESETDNDNGWYYKNHTRYGATMSLYASPQNVILTLSKAPVPLGKSVRRHRTSRISAAVTATRRHGSGPWKQKKAGSLKC